MKRLVLIISLLFLSSNFLLAQSFGGVRHLRTQGVVGFQNGVGLDVEYVLPVLNERIAVRTGFAVSPISFGSLDMEGLKGDLDLTGNTFDLGLKFYFSGRSHGMFLGLDIGFDNKNIALSNINGNSSDLKNAAGEVQENVEISNGKFEDKFSTMIITPKIGITKVGTNGFTWSFEVGYSLMNTDALNVSLTGNVDGSPETYNYTFDNIYKDIFGMGGLPYAKIGFGYSFKLTTQTY